MTRNFLKLFLAASTLLSACVSNQKTEDSKQKDTASHRETVVPYSTARNYFVRNDYNDADIHCIMVSSQIEFDSIFGMATTMGQEGKPTRIDFDETYVVALIGKITDKTTTLSVVGLVKNDNQLMLKYRLDEGGVQSFSMRPFVILIINIQHQGELVLNREM